MTKCRDASELALRYDRYSEGENKPENEVKEYLKYCRECVENEKVGAEKVTEMEMKKARLQREGGLNKKRSEEVSVKENNVKNDTSVRCIKHPLKANVRQYFPSRII